MICASNFRAFGCKVWLYVNSLRDQMGNRKYSTRILDAISLGLATNNGMSCYSECKNLYPWYQKAKAIIWRPFWRDTFSIQQWEDSQARQESPSYQHPQAMSSTFLAHLGSILQIACSEYLWDGQSCSARWCPHHDPCKWAQYLYKDHSINKISKICWRTSCFHQSSERNSGSHRPPSKRYQERPE